MEKTRAISVLWLEAGSGCAPAGSEEAYCTGCGRFFLPGGNFMCADCVTRWYEEREEGKCPSLPKVAFTRTFLIQFICECTGTGRIWAG